MKDISVIVPYYNDNKLRYCLKKLFLEYNKLGENKKKVIEIILINDGSKKTNYINYNQNIKIINKKNEGVGKARNVGLKLAKKSYVLFVDSDILIPDNFFLKIDHIIKNKNKKIFYFPQKYVPADNDPNLFQKYLSLSWFINQTKDFKSKEMITSFCLLVEREYFLRLGGFEEKFKKSGGEEFELISKIKSHYIKICELYCYHFQDKFFVRLKKLFLRSLNFKKVIIKNKGFSVSTKSNFFYRVLISLLIILSFLGSIFFFKFFYILLINIIIFIFIEKKFFIFLTKKRFYNLIFASFFFKIIENVIIMCGVFLSYIKNDKRF